MTLETGSWKLEAGRKSENRKFLRISSLQSPVSSLQGYTLIELIVAVGLFALVMTLAAGAYLLMINLSRQAQGTATGIDNLAFALETITRSIRTGALYSCGDFGGDCPNGESSFSFRNASGAMVTYALAGSAPDLYIQRTVDGVAQSALTDPSSVAISSLIFYVSGVETVALGEYTQPYVTIVISGVVSSGTEKTTQSFAIETSSTMRGIDLTVILPPSENPPTPTCTLVADSISILSGGSSVLSWMAVNAFSFSIDQGIGVVPSAAGGTYAVSPPTTTTYTGTASNEEGSATCTAEVAVIPAPVIGQCAPTHYNCVAGTDADHGGGPDTWTWSCNGSGGGTNASCTEEKQDITWTERNAPNGNWHSVTYGSGLFVAVGSASGSNDAMTSPDGITWTSRTTPNATWGAVTYGNGLFVAVKSSGSQDAMTSPDGITWTSRSISNGTWHSVTYNSGLFVAVGDSGTITSPNGITWTSRSIPNGNWHSVTYGSGLFVAVGSASGANDAMTSPDGITWTSRSTQNATWDAVTYGNGLFVAVKSSGSNDVMTSPDGITWTSPSGVPSGDWRSVTYGNTMFVAVGNYGDVMTSP